MSALFVLFIIVVGLLFAALIGYARLSMTQSTQRMERRLMEMELEMREHREGYSQKPKRDLLGEVDHIGDDGEIVYKVKRGDDGFPPIPAAPDDPPGYTSVSKFSDGSSNVPVIKPPPIKSERISW